MKVLRRNTIRRLSIANMQLSFRNQSQKPSSMDRMQSQRMHAVSLDRGGNRHFANPVLTNFFDLAEKGEVGYCAVARVSDAMLSRFEQRNLKGKPIGETSDGAFNLGSRGTLSIPGFEGPKSVLDRWIIDRLTVSESESEAAYQDYRRRHNENARIAFQVRNDLRRFKDGLFPKGVVAIGIYEPEILRRDEKGVSARIWNRAREVWAATPIGRSDRRIVTLSIIPPRDLYDLGPEFRFKGKYPMAVGINFNLSKALAEDFADYLRRYDGRYHLRDLFVHGQIGLPPVAERLMEWIFDGFFVPLVRKGHNNLLQLVIEDYVGASTLDPVHARQIRSELMDDASFHSILRRNR